MVALDYFELLRSYFSYASKALMVRFPVKTTVFNFFSDQNVERHDDASQVFYL